MNGLALVELIIWITVEAVQRLINPEAMNPWPALLVATLGLIVNLIAFRLLHDTNSNTNIRSAALHVLGDLLDSMAAMVAAVVVMTVGWLYADQMLAIAIALILSRGVYGVLQESAHMLLEGVPAGVNLSQIEATLTEEIDEVDGVHQVLAWALTAEKPLLTLNALVPKNAKVQKVIVDVKQLLKERFGIEHSTIKIELG